MRPRRRNIALANWPKLSEAISGYSEPFRTNQGLLHELDCVLWQQGIYKSAATQIRRAVKSDGTIPVYHSNLATVMHGQRQIGSDIERHSETLRPDPSNIQAQFSLVIAYTHAGQHKTSERYLDLKPKHIGALNYLVVIQLKKRNASEAVRLYGQAIAIDPNVAEIHAGLGNALQGQGINDQALTSYRKAMKRRPNLPGLAHAMGCLLARTGFY